MMAVSEKEKEKESAKQEKSTISPEREKALKLAIEKIEKDFDFIIFKILIRNLISFLSC